ncbi:hypothetical protein LAZ67_11000764 [Cordylochernes scorpioides]|uniref:ubiquitinyl hydrolase 1 n=1 Tax=Cordylochernes scorpioides TaxID=51811 RepID=A0ABY6L0A9_9ARAC|nr:hypothetical protein LAZ67_11000764 [Cordylochernes scorpioides]
MEEEFDSLIENKTWELVDPPKGQNVIGSKWVLKKRYSSDGSLERHKARLVARGFSQQYGIDYEETFAPVVRQSTIRVFLALAVEYNLIVHQMDVQSAYLNGEIKEEVYMAQPENFVSRKYPEKVCRLKKAIYGLKQAGIVWHEKLDTELKYLGLKQIQSDNCVYIKHHEGILLVAIYVDDLIIAAEREDTLISFKESMKKIFKIKDLGKINYCLGIRIQTEKDGSISIDQEKYIEELLAKYRMKEVKPISTPMDSNSKLTKISSIEVSTRPDISYAVSALGQFSNDPRRQHWNAAKRVLRYLKGTLGLKITYEKTNETLYGYVDADWGGNLADRKSQTGLVFFLAGGPIAWESKKQQTVALSSTESEYIALCEAGKEAVYLRALLDEMGFDEAADTAAPSTKKEEVSPPSDCCSQTTSENGSGLIEAPPQSGNVEPPVLEGAPKLKPHAVGLYNLGNTCYSNAIVQSLAHTTAVLENCLWNCKPENINPDSISGGQIIKRFANLLDVLWKEENSFRPIEFHKQVGMFEERFGDYSEQDSMEFLQFLLEHLHNDLHRVSETDPIADGIDEGSRFWHEYRAKENCPIVHMFAGQTVYATHCQNCPRTSQNFEAFWHLSLPIPENKDISLLECFDQLFVKEVINDFICPECSKKGSVRTVNVINWPNILIAQLIRFPDFGGGKNNTMVDIPPILDLAKFGSEAKYKLYAIVNHYGTPHTGHFTSVCKHPTSGEWFTMDDHRVKNTNSNKVITKNAYILFYERVK